MSENIRIVRIGADNLEKFPEVICFINPKHNSYPLKIEWLKNRFAEGLCIKLLYVEGSKRAAGFIEYVPGENAWRAVSATQYMFIHCLYMYPNENKNKGYGSLLIRECLNDALTQERAGVAVVVSDKAFMAERNIFLKNGFVPVQSDGAGNELLVKSLKAAPLPAFNNWQERLSAFGGLHIVYSKQCPWVARLIDEIKASGIMEKLEIHISELTTPAQAQQAPSVYATFSLIHHGKLLADRYISLTRFRNILKQQKLLPAVLF